MAKQRRVNRQAAAPSSIQTEQSADASTAQTGGGRIEPLAIAAAMIGGACIYVSYYPSDSVAVENGDALWLGVIALLIATVTWAASLWQGGLGVSQRANRSLSWLIDLIPWLLAFWMMAGAFATSPPGNLREATNEAWLWFSGAAIFTSARRLMSWQQTPRAVLALLAVCALGQAVHGLHQQFVSLPQSRADYRQDPEGMLSELGLDAPAGSAERMVFENRLFDGGPTGTFALANSLAAVLLVGVILSAGVLRNSWTGSSAIGRTAWLLILMICLVCLLAARSRSATLAVIVGIVLMFVLSARAGSQQIGTTASLVFKGVLAIAALGLATIIGLAAFGNAEWFTQAPASLAFRLQYWRATSAMAFDRPVFAAGPGNFQSIYLRYREPSANEQIAEPHNFLFETLASGGFAALLMLIGLMVCVSLYVRRQGASVTDCETPQDNSAQWVWLGAGVAFVFTWLIAAAAGRLPDLQANLLVVPIAIAIAWFAWPAMRLLRRQQLNALASAALIALLVHCLAAGGWTIPGVAWNVWLLAGLITRLDHDPASRPAPPWSVGSLLLGLALLATLRAMSLVPAQSAQLAIANAQYWQTRGQARQTESSLRRAIETDPWSPAAAIWQADLFHWKLITEGDSADTRLAWKQFLTMTMERAGEDPSLWEAIGHQQLHLYQRYGDAADLAAADETFGQVVRWDPWSPRAVAQLAAIANRRDDQPRAREFARRADYLAGLGNNIERDLERQLIYVPEPAGRRAAEKPVLATASDLLANHLSPADVSP